jgi:acetylornithine deacetylase/succinyl-diaminopimelate desuccinylase-like protein
VQRWLHDAGLPTEIDEPAPGRPSVIATAAGTGGGRSLMLNAHLDTVGGQVPQRIDGNRLHGRGAFDMKASVAACLVVAAAVRDLRGDLIVTLVSDEEHASLGTASVLTTHTADGCIVTEPTGLRACVAHKGFAWAEVETQGTAAHGSRPDLGEDAIVRMGPILVKLDELSERLKQDDHPLLGSPSVHASLIEGGQELSSYPERCTLQIERRTLPGETDEAVRQELEQLGGTLTMGLTRPPFAADNQELIRLVSSEEPIGHPAWMDAALTAQQGIPTVVFGPAGAGAHAADEWVELDSVVRCAETLLAAAERWCA